MDELYISGLRQKYTETIVPIWLHTSKKAAFGFIRHISYNKIKVILCDNNGKDTEYTDKLSEVSFLKIPRNRCFNYKNRVLYFQHNAERQWSVGLTEANCLFTDPVMDLMREALGGTHTVKAVNRTMNIFRDLWNLFFDDTDKKISEAIAEMLAGGHIARTINKDWFVSLSGEDGVYLLFYRVTPVAYVGERVIKPLNKSLQQEVIDLINRQGDHYVVG